MAVEKDYGVRLEKLRFGVIHKKVGVFKSGLLIAPAYRRQGMRNLEHSGIA
jgi:hypothetical protein